ncbi:hypothetical protein ACBJ59_10790 [Nonomuraea sp. MTCD27]|uniref:hypothetical protein n=1 Tax=Nonomuraea sp. MTCD27 TaxID=1676747 RepID=UPI0035C0FDF4
MDQPRVWIAPPGSIIDDGLNYPEPEVTAAGILEAWRRLQPRVTVFCPPADVESVTAWCENHPDVRVIGHKLVPEGEIWMFKDQPFTIDVLEGRL